MTSFSKSILTHHQVRKSYAQKSAFIQLLQGQFPQMKIEESGRVFRNRNLVVGDLAHAKYVFCAHYDTCAQLPFPNFIAPKNIIAMVFYFFVLALPLMLLFSLIPAILSYLGLPFLLYFPIIFLLVCGLQLLVLFGKANPHTVNDNTSGVLTLCELMQSLSDEEKEQVAFVFFDLEEAGLIGSSRFHKQHKKEMEKKLLINFDCVSDGNHALICLNQKAQKNYRTEMEAAFVTNETIQVTFATTRTTFYPSDQIHFPQSVAVCFLKKKRFIGLYMDRIHTKRDTVLQEDNLIFLTQACRKLLRHKDLSC